MSDFFKRELKLALITAPLNIPIGIVVVFLLMALMLGSVNDAFVLLLASIICTLGISLLIWVPVWYGVGYLCMALLRVLIIRTTGKDIYPASITRRREAVQPTAAAPAGDSSSPNLSRDEQAVVNYIKKALAKGLNREFITKALQANGWNVESINKGFQVVEKGV